jgi:hypothetical protein
VVLVIKAYTHCLARHARRQQFKFRERLLSPGHRFQTTERIGYRKDHLTVHYPEEYLSLTTKTSNTHSAIYLLLDKAGT